MSRQTVLFFFFFVLRRIIYESEKFSNKFAPHVHVARKNKTKQPIGWYRLRFRQCDSSSDRWSMAFTGLLMGFFVFHLFLCDGEFNSSKSLPPAERWIFYCGYAAGWWTQCLAYRFLTVAFIRNCISSSSESSRFVDLCRSFVAITSTQEWTSIKSFSLPILLWMAICDVATTAPCHINVVRFINFRLTSHRRLEFA